MRPSHLYLSVVVVLLPACLLVAQPVAAQVLAFGTALGFPGDVVTITATLDTKGTRISALGGDIQFDANAFSIQGCTLNSTISGKSLSTNLVQPGLDRFIVFGLNQGLLPDGVLFTCDLFILPGGSTSALSIPTLSAADPQGNSVRLAVQAGGVVVLSASAKSNASGRCNVNTCRTTITICETVHGCGGLRGGTQASCRKDCREGVIAACQADQTLSLCH